MSFESLGDTDLILLHVPMEHTSLLATAAAPSKVLGTIVGESNSNSNSTALTSGSCAGSNASNIAAAFGNNEVYAQGRGSVRDSARMRASVGNESVKSNQEALDVGSPYIGSHYEHLPEHGTTDKIVLAQGYISGKMDSPSMSALGKNKPEALQGHEFPGWGDLENLKHLQSEGNYRHIDEDEKLSEWLATAICGNDITSSCFYCTGLVISSAGVWSPICTALVSLTLYLFRSVYGEAVTALPLNGGAYNVLLNTTSKATASVAACLTILSYVATGVVSAGSAISYFGNLWPNEPVIILVISLLGLFAVLTLFGITDSAKTALLIFVLHISTLIILVITSVVTICKGAPTFLAYNYANFTPHFSHALFYGFAASMLGVTGFETSANFVEEQREGVFVLTLRNMWAICTFFNPVLTLLTITLCSVQDINASPDDSLAALGAAAAGEWLRYLVSLDAFIVLSGAVLTSYVGVTGLCRRLAMDRCMPSFLLAENEWRRTNHWIILGFFGLCTSLYLILRGNVNSLSNVYTISFLCVMALFAIGDMLLKYKRNDIPRSVHASWPTVLLAFVLVIVAIAGTIDHNREILSVWALYFLGTGVLMSTMFFRVQMLKLTHFFLKKIFKFFRVENPSVLKNLADIIQDINSQPIAFFAKHATLSLINKAVLYVRQNEDCGWLKIIHIYEDEKSIDPLFERNIRMIDETYPKIRIDLVLVKGVFSPKIVDELSRELNIPKNLMFLPCPREDFSHKVSSLGGVRLITH